MPKDVLPVLDGEFQTLNKEYVQSWGVDVADWHRHKLYERIADFVDLEEGDVHFDVGSGFGDSLLALNRKVSKAALVGVDNNLSMLMAANRNLLDNGCRGIGYAQVGTGIVDGRHMTKYIFDESLLRKLGLLPPDIFVPHPNVVRLICDDIRSKEVVSKILEGHLIDSGTLSMVGSSGASSYQYPYLLKDWPGREESLRRCGETNRRIRTGAMEFMSEFVKPNGVLVVADRISPDATSENITASIDEFVWPAPEFWDIERTYVSPEPISVVGGTKIRDPGRKDVARIKLFLGKFRRNERKFVE